MRNKKRVFAFDPLQDFNARYLPLDKILKLDDQNAFIAGEKYRVATTDPDDLEVIAALALLSGDTWLMIEEAGFLFPPGSRAPDWMREGAFIGRHQKLNILITAQRPTSIPVDLRSQASRVICFGQREQRDMQWLGEYFGDRYKEITLLDRLECLDSEENSTSCYKIPWDRDDKNKIIE